MYVVNVPSESIIVIDLDDTLYPERDFQKSGFNAILEHFHLGAQFSASELVRVSLHGQDVLTHLGLNESERTEALVIYRSHMPAITAYSDAQVFLRRACAAGCRLALATDGRSNTQRNKITALEIASYFTWILISDEIGHVKREAEFYENFLVALSEEPSTFIGDNPAKDFVIPNQRGWHTIMLRERHSNVHAQTLENVDTIHRPQDIITDFSEIEFS